MCQYCELIFNSKVLGMEKEFGAIDKAFEENETIKIMNCPRCNKPNKVYYFKEMVFLTGKVKEEEIG